MESDLHLFPDWCSEVRDIDFSSAGPCQTSKESKNTNADISRVALAKLLQFFGSKFYFQKSIFSFWGGGRDTSTDAFRVTRCSTYTDDMPLYKLNSTLTLQMVDLTFKQLYEGRINVTAQTIKGPLNSFMESLTLFRSNWDWSCDTSDWVTVGSKWNVQI